MNGSDYLSYLTISNGTVTPYTALTTPSAPTLTTDNVGGSGFPITYRVTANSTVGETAASNALTVDVDTDRDLWTGTDNVIIGLPTVTNAASLNVYMGTVAGYEYLIAKGLPNGGSFTDDGTAAQDPTRLFPTTDSTAGPRASRGTVINSRAWLVGDADNPYYVWFGGDYGHELDFSPANGGGNQPVGSGTKDLPIAIKQFRDAKGSPVITALTQGSNGRGKRFTFTPETLTFGSTIIPYFAVAEENGQDGTDSPNGIITYGDSLYYPSRDGFKTTGTKPQLQNVLSTDRISNTIQPDLALINNDVMEKAVGLGFEGRLYWALPVSSESNSEVWVLDLERKGAWMKPWSIEADWLWLYNDNEGVTHFLILSNNVIYETSYSSLTQDDGVPFSTLGSSGEVYFSDDKRMWAQLLQIVIVLLDAQGTVSFEALGKNEDGDVVPLGDPVTFNPSSQTTVAGWGEPNKYVPGWGQNDWSQIGEVASSTGANTSEVIIPIDEEVQWASYSWSSTGVGVDYNISDVIFEYIETGIKDLQ